MPFVRHRLTPLQFVHHAYPPRRRCQRPRRQESSINCSGWRIWIICCSPAMVVSWMHWQLKWRRPRRSKTAVASCTHTHGPAQDTENLQLLLFIDWLSWSVMLSMFVNKMLAVYWLRLFTVWPLVVVIANCFSTLVTRVGGSRFAFFSGVAVLSTIETSFTRKNKKIFSNIIYNYPRIVGHSNSSLSAR